MALKDVLRADVLTSEKRRIRVDIRDAFPLDLGKSLRTWQVSHARLLNSFPEESVPVVTEGRIGELELPLSRLLHVLEVLTVDLCPVCHNVAAGIVSVNRHISQQVSVS